MIQYAGLPVTPKRVAGQYYPLAESSVSTQLASFALNLAHCALAVESHCNCHKLMAQVQMCFLMQDWQCVEMHEYFAEIAWTAAGAMGLTIDRRGRSRILTCSCDDKERASREPYFCVTTLDPHTRRGNRRNLLRLSAVLGEPVSEEDASGAACMPNVGSRPRRRRIRRSRLARRGPAREPCSTWTGPGAGVSAVGRDGHAVTRWPASSDTFAHHNGTAPLPLWSSNKQRHRLSRTGNRQHNAAVHRIALTTST